MKTKLKRWGSKQEFTKLSHGRSLLFSWVSTPQEVFCTFELSVFSYRPCCMHLLSTRTASLNYSLFTSTCTYLLINFFQIKQVFNLILPKLSLAKFLNFLFFVLQLKNDSNWLGKGANFQLALFFQNHKTADALKLR